MKNRSAILFIATASLFAACPAVRAQNAASNTSSLLRVTDEARKNYPTIRISQEDLNASAARLALARTAYLPRLDGLAQFNRGTRNNVFGPLLPQAVVPSMSGPVIGTNNSGSVWGSATGLLANWQPFDFGLRHASVTAAEAAKERARAAGQRTELQVVAGSADAYLTELATVSTRTAAAAAVRNWETLKTSIHALVAAELRPAADESRVEAEQAAALNQLAMADEAIETSRSTMMKFAPDAGAGSPSEDGMMKVMPDLSLVDPTFVPSQNPAVAEQVAIVKQNTAQLHAVERSWTPQFNVEAAVYGRGTGAEINGQRLSGANGLAPTTGNYVAGVNITFPFLDLASVHAREVEQAANLRAAKATQELTVRTVQEQFSHALATLRAAKTIAANTPVQVDSARAALDQATARYKAGLARIDDVAQAQRLFVQAQMDDSVARLNVWRAFLHLQFVRGDLQPFLNQAGR